MSIDLNWETVTGGPDGQELADKIRDFIHTKFQSVPLPRFIKSVTVHDFQFGTIPPEIELKDITDPLPDFYEDHVDSDLATDSEGEDDAQGSVAHASQERRRPPPESDLLAGGARGLGRLPPYPMFGGPASSRNGDIGSPFMRVSTPGIPGGTANLHYFHSHLASGLSGTQTPLAAVAGAHHLSTVNWLEGHGHSSSVPNLHRYGSNFAGASGTPRQYPEPSHSRNPSQSSISIADFNPTPNLPPPSSSTNLTLPSLREKHSVSTLAPTSAGTSRPPTRDAAATLMGSAISDDPDDEYNNDGSGGGGGGISPTTGTGPGPSPGLGSSRQQLHQQQQGQDDEDQPRFREARLEDMQAVFRIRYAGDVKLLLTADILLDYPMPSFVGIPVRLSITGLTFDGVGVLAKIRKRVHFCFLSPEDAVAAVGDESMGGEGEWKQSLKNVGKVERFVLEQVRRIFEEEFVYPSFWTFLV
ncbi:Mitochondrial distribution and morphology protein 12 [Staphylotrichum longicolle]|uniref:Mitochondrial distribution and morphology protein 12 n=1 Tax=Staphylotrichum longicolle TaxID=669026 RepID=A0AAD4F512_9PEZI|nr:Mitochondrial distribution and morphology protein 12 [Staphylotrichum longicolle]